MAALAAAAVVTGGAVAPAGAGAAPATGHAGAPVTPNTSSTFYVTASELDGVSAVSGSDAWAVGSYSDTSALASKTLILHWNGAAWSKVNSPNVPGSYANDLYGVSAGSGSDAWAVGSYTDISGPAPTYKTLILHWNGAAWSKVNSPSPGPGFNELRGVSAVSGSDAWAVGYYDGYPARAYKTLMLHWNGTSWSKVNSPNPSTSPFSSNANDLYGVSAVSGSDAWAVGGYDDNAADQTLMLHWNGTAWSKVNSPADPHTDFTLNGVSAVSGSDAWAVGSYGALGSAFFDTMILHWDGTAWTRVRSPSPGSGSYLQDENYLRGVSAVSGSDAWAVGDYTDPTTGNYKTMILHWDGTAWTQVNSPSPSRGNLNELHGVSARAGSDAWAVGSYIDTTGAPKMLVLHWNGTAWANAPAVKTATSVSSSANPVTTGNPVTYTATVTPTPAQNAGTVDFYDNGKLIRSCSARINSGRGTCTITYASAGSHTIKATYSGYAVLAGRSTSPPLTETVKTPATASAPVSSR